MAGFFYGQDHEELLIRLKDGYDGSQPSENSMAALRMLKLAKLTSDYKLEEKVEQIFQAFASEVGSYPTIYVCENFVCNKPTSDGESAFRMLTVKK